ncbi:Compactin diketide synthase mokB [Cladorrhinum sp. PSN332]|nr:Compactin diketide synthase mokB [Cladorrhinum sp. PSN332]
MSKDGSMPIAIVGIACRFPGDATNPERLWDMLAKGQNTHGTWPKDRFNINAFYHPNPERYGSFNTRGGNFLKEDVIGFDAPFFSISAKEAHAMDPQQRIALELTFEALENAGIRIQDVAGSDMGCYMACFAHDYLRLRCHDPDDFPLYEGTGNFQPLLANRVSWYFDLRGPSFALDTACSSSLVALHQACQSIRSGETTSMIVGGANLMFMPELPMALSALHFLSPDAKCKTFDASANGYARGEGAAVVILKRLDAALRDGNVIRAVIRGTGVNQDGRTPGITVPSSKAQEELIRNTYAAAGLDFTDTQYFEAHGTGTAVGDPAECSAIGATFGKSRTPEQPNLLVGSIKPNIGHLEAAAGMAGLIKAVHCVEQGQIPPNLWFKNPNPRIDFEGWRLKVPTELLPWPTEGVRRASINSFGYGGTNAHCVIDDAYHYLKEHGLQGAHNTRVESVATSITRPLDTHHPRLLIWSSHEQKGTERQAATLLSHLNDKHDPNKTIDGQPELLDRLVYTLSDKRSRFPWRSFAVVSNLDDARAALASPRKPLRASDTPVLTFVFTGQGAQWYAMGRELATYRVYRESLEAASSYMRALGAEWYLMDELMADEKASRVGEPAISQPACTALQVALVDLLADWNIHPSVVVGHSSGEIAAAYAKGAITRESAWLVSYHRGRLSAAITAKGTMMAVGLGEDQVAPYIDRIRQSCDEASGSSLVVACINSPSSVTVSGDANLVSKLQTALEGEKVFTRRLAIKRAYHSPHMVAVADQYLEAMKGLEEMHQSVEPSTTITMFSSVTGYLIEAKDIAKPSYWVSNLVNPVKFSRALHAALNYSPPKRNTIIEVGPHAGLQGPIKQILKAQTKTEIPYVSVIVREIDARQAALEAVGVLIQRGCSVDVSRANNPLELPTSNMQLTDIPPVAWNRSTRYWHESPATRAWRFRALPRHDLLGARSEYSSDVEPSWRNYLRVSEIPWIEHHQVQNSILYPVAGMIVMAIEATRQVVADADTATREIEGFQLRDISVGSALVVLHRHDGGGREGSIETKLQLRPWRTGSKSLDHAWHEFTIASRNSEGSWTQNCAGLISIKYRAPPNSTFADEARIKAARHREQYHKLAGAGMPQVPIDSFYSFLATLGVQLGPAFQTLTHVGSCNYEAHCHLTVSDTAAMMPENYEQEHIIHPATLDGVVQMAALAATARGLSVDSAKVPQFIESAYVSAKMAGRKAGHRMVGYARSNPQGHNEHVGTAVIGDLDWDEPLVVLEGCRTIVLESLEGAQGASPQQEDAAFKESLKKLGARHHWGVDIELASPDALTELLLQSVENIPDASNDAIRDLEHACYIFCRRATRELNTPEAKASFSPHHRLFFEFMQRQVERATEYKLMCQPQQGDQAADWLSATDELDDEVLARVAAGSVDGKLLYRVGVNLGQILTGTLEPLQVLREDDLLTAYYRTAIGTTRIQTIIGQYARLLSHKRPLRVLEVGAGTGGTTAVVLKALGDQAEAAGRLVSYMFTDISSGFFEAAAEDFKEWSPFLNFRVLNMEKEPAEQGFELGSYDIVVASNVIHATSSIATSLKHCKSLLKPGGVLAIEEITTKHARVPMVVGILPGWWNGESDGRKEGPLITEEEWNRHLRCQGFNGLHLRFRDSAGEHYLKSFMVSVASVEPVRSSPHQIVIIKPNARDDAVDNLASAICQFLAQDGYASIEHMTLAQSATADLRGKACIATIEANTSFLVKVTTDDFNNIKYLILTSGSTLWLTRGGAMESSKPEANLMVGLARTIRAENPSIRIATLDLDPGQALNFDKTAEVIKKVFAAKVSDTKNSEWEYAVRGDQVHILRLHTSPELSAALINPEEKQQPRTRLLPLKQAGDRALKLDIKTPGILNTLQYVDDPEHYQALAEHHVEITVKAVPMNFHDVMIAMGHIDDSSGSDDTFGVECSGVISRIGSAVQSLAVGDRVVTCHIGSWRTYVRNHESAVQKIPDHMSFVEAASFPSVYAAAIYSLVDMARLQQGETLLIHAASGGFGQASIVMARHLGASAVYCTVGSEAKKQLLIDAYGIPEEHILDSRDHVSFAAGVKRLTNGRGVDVVLNSLAGEALRQTWLCLAPFGRFIELGKKDMFGNSGLDMAPFLRNTMFVGVNMGTIFNHSIPLSARLLKDIMQLRSEDVIKPLQPVTTMNFSQTEEAYRTMQTGKHIGKIVLVPREDDIVPVSLSPLVVKKPAALSLRPDATYLLPGGLGGLGRSLATRMAARGARYLVFTSRSGATKPEAQALLAKLEEQGVKTNAFACDIGDEAELQRILKEIEALGFPKIAGTVTFAMQIQDVFFENMTAADFQAAVSPKVNVTRNMHMFLPKDLDFFICMSSVAGVVGSRGQGNYNAGNTYQDAMARHRRALGLKGTSIDLGIVEGVGFAANQGVTAQRFLTKGAAVWLTEDNVLDSIEAAMAEPLSSSSSAGVIDEAEAVIGLSTGGLLKAGGYDEPYWFSEARFASVRVYDTQTHQQHKSSASTGSQSLGSGGGDEIRAALAAAKDVDEAAAVALSALKRKLARAMMMDEVDVDSESPLNAYGIDSLVAVEIRAWVFKELRSEVSVFEILSNASLASLAGIIAGRTTVGRVGGGGKAEGEE